MKKPVAPTSDWTNRVHSFRGRDCSSKSLEVDPGHALARLIRAQDSHSSDRGEGEGDRRCRLAPSLTDRGRGYPTEIRIRGGGRQSANSCRSRSPREFPVSSRSHQQTDVAMAVEPRRRHYGGDPPTAMRVVIGTSVVGLVTIPLWIRFGLKFAGLQ